MLRHSVQRQPFQCKTSCITHGASLSRRAPRASIACRASAKAAELLQEGFFKYKTGDAMTALKAFEEALSQDDVTRRQRQEALYACTCVHARFGDVELAQMTLRDAIAAGLDYEQALQDPDLIQPRTSVQITLQLRKFAEKMQSAASSKPAPASTTQRPGARGSNPAPQTIEEIAGMLGTPDSDMAAVDVSVGGIIRRVSLVLGVMVAGILVLFFGGLSLWPLDERINVADYQDMEALYPEGVPDAVRQALGPADDDLAAPDMGSLYPEDLAGGAAGAPGL